MANLLALPTRAKQVRNLQLHAFRYGHFWGGDDNTMLDPLDTMIATVETQEARFYQDIQCGSYAGLLERMREVPDNGFQSLLPNGKIFQFYSQTYRFPISATMSEAVDDLEIMINNLQKNNPDLFTELMNTAAEDFQNKALETIRQYFKELEITKGRKGGFRFTGAAGAKVGLARLTFKNEGGKLSISYSGDTKLSGSLLQKIRQAAMIIQENTHKGKQLVTEKFPTKESFKEDVIRQILRQTSGDTRIILQSVLSKEASNIEITRSYAGLKGFLGEVRALAILAHFFGLKQIEGTGPLKEVATKQSIAVDTLLKLGVKHYGFQVKNYTLKENSVTFDRTLNAVDFVNDRLCVTGNIRDILLAFFGSYQFNQPFGTKELIERFENSWMTVPEYEEIIYNSFQSGFAALQDLFDSRMGSILRIGRNFSVSDSDGNGHAVFGEEKMYYNTFFFIEKEIVPSSVILRAIKEAIQTGLQNSVTTKYELSKPEVSPTFEQNYKEPKPSENLLVAAKKPEVSYSITLNVADLVKRALNKI